VPGRPPAFSPDVARALQELEGSVAFTYTRPRDSRWPPAHDVPLMETPYERVLAAVVLDTKLNLRFVRTGSRAEGARMAMTSAAGVIAAPTWHVELEWNLEEMAVRVRVA
jgi:hypothetical protein